MLSSVLNSKRAVQMNILIIRAFVRLRELMSTHKELARKIEQLEATQKQHSRTQQEHTIILEAVVKDIQKLKHPPTTRAIGFVVRAPKEEVTLSQSPQRRPSNDRRAPRRLQRHRTPVLFPKDRPRRSPVQRFDPHRPGGGKMIENQCYGHQTPAHP